MKVGEVLENARKKKAAVTCESCKIDLSVDAVNEERAKALSEIIRYDVENHGDVNEKTVLRAIELAGLADLRLV
jgi:uncharacterized OsmC-like protein